MKHLILILILIPFASYFDANASCLESCFSKKAHCNHRHGHTHNSCDNDLFACRASCSSGKSQSDYQKVSPIHLSLN